MKHIEYPTQDVLKSYVHYDPETGVFTWLKRPDDGTSWNSRWVAKRAGGKLWNGYRMIAIMDVQYYEHRLAWIYIHGVQPPHDVDHIDAVRDNNAINNLRLATRTQNLQRKAVKSGPLPRGVARNHSRFLAQITVNGQFKYLGTYDTPEQAHAVYVAAARDNFGEFSPV